MGKIEYKYVNEHIIAKVCGYDMLVDTGTNRTILLDQFGLIRIDGKMYTIDKQDVLADERAKMEQFIGCRIDGFLGTDIMGNLAVIAIEKPINNKGYIYTGEDAKEFINSSVKNEVDIEDMRVTATVNGHPNCKVYLDTGAKYGYGRKELYEGLAPISKEDDYNPDIRLHDFKLDYYGRLTVEINNKAYEIKMAYNEVVEEIHLNRYGLDVICNIMYMCENYSVIDFVNNKLYLN